MAINERVREAILALPEAMWRPAIDGDNQPRDGAWVAELTDHLALDARPEGSRLIVRASVRIPAPRRLLGTNSGSAGRDRRSLTEGDVSAPRRHRWRAAPSDETR
jgi:hypothetical protein